MSRPLASPSAASRPGHRPGVLRRPPTERERIAEAIARRLDGPVTALGVVFVLVVLAQTTADPRGGLGVALDAASWAMWAVFVAEFVVRMVVAPSTWGFLRRNWWQVAFLAVPFLRFLRFVRVVRVGRFARIGRVVSSAVRSTRTAKRRLGDRLGWLAAATAIVVLSASQVLFELGDFASYGDALHATAVTTVAGEPLDQEGGAARVLGLLLLAYSVVVFATVAGSVGAFLLERRDEKEAGPTGGGDGPAPRPA